MKKKKRFKTLKNGKRICLDQDEDCIGNVCTLCEDKKKTIKKKKTKKKHRKHENYEPIAGHGGHEPWYDERPSIF